MFFRILERVVDNQWRYVQLYCIQKMHKGDTGLMYSFFYLHNVVGIRQGCDAIALKLQLFEGGTD